MEEQDIKINKEIQAKNISVSYTISTLQCPTFQPQEVNSLQYFEYSVIQPIPFETFLSNLDQLLRKNSKKKEEKNLKNLEKRRKKVNLYLRISRFSPTKIFQNLCKRRIITKNRSFLIAQHLKPLQMLFYSSLKRKPRISDCLNSLKKKRLIE